MPSNTVEYLLPAYVLQELWICCITEAAGRNLSEYKNINILNFNNPKCSKIEKFAHVFEAWPRSSGSSRWSSRWPKKCCLPFLPLRLQLQPPTPSTLGCQGSTGLAPACSFCRLSLLWRPYGTKRNRRWRTNRRNQSIPSKKLLAGQDSCPVWTKRRDSRSHEMPRSCHTGHSAICILMRLSTCRHIGSQNFRGIQGTKVLRWSAFSVVDILTNQSTRFELLQLKLILP